MALPPRQDVARARRSRQARGYAGRRANEQLSPTPRGSVGADCAHCACRDRLRGGRVAYPRRRPRPRAGAGPGSQTPPGQAVGGGRARCDHSAGRRVDRRRGCSRGDRYARGAGHRSRGGAVAARRRVRHADTTDRWAAHCPRMVRACGGPGCEGDTPSPGRLYPCPAPCPAPLGASGG